MNKIIRPKGHDDSIFIVSMSGGKDSTALALAMREADISCRHVFADTGWEAPETYEYLATLERILGITIDRVGVSGGFAAQAIKEGILPHGKTAWCTRELKVKPIRAYFDSIDIVSESDTVSVVGIRGEESAKRAEMAWFEYCTMWKGYVWRPLLSWKIADVLAIHHRHGVPVNPLYTKGFSRVGCAPCRNANKDDMRMWAEHHPERIDAVRTLESAVTTERARRGHSGAATFFTDGPKPMPIDDVVAWSRTSRGGVQLKLLQENPDSGCFRWGMCDPPTKDGE